MTSTIAEAALGLSRSVELSLLVKATILLALGLAAARLARRSRASVRHLVLATTFAALIALPLVVLTAPGVALEVPLSRAGDSRGAVGAADAPSEPLLPFTGRAIDRLESGHRFAPSWPTVIRTAWCAGAMLMTVSLGVAIWRLRRIRRDGLPWPECNARVRSLATECGLRRSVEVLLHEDLPAPLTYGIWHPAIVLPSDAREWREGDLRRALVHELEHLRRGDWAIQLMARATCAGYWFHPLAWMAWRRLCLEAERACDDAVVRSAERTDYADQLVLLARRLSGCHAGAARRKWAADSPAMLGMAKRSDLSKRVTTLLDDRQRRGRAGAFVAASALIVACLAVGAIAPVRAIATTRPDAGPTAEQRSDRGGTLERRVRGIDRALYEAAENGDLAEIDQLLQVGANVNAALDGDGSPLIGAAREGRLEAARFLLDRGADPNMPVPGDGNPLIMAAREGHADVVTVLLDGGASIDQMVRGDETGLIQASGEGQLEVVKLLVARGANVNLGVWVEEPATGLQREWRSPLGMARRGRHAGVVAFLLSAGARE
jgi:bla regulator protein blaR1